MTIAWGNVLLPKDQNELTAFYLFWMSLFLVVNVAWDWITPLTRDFHFLHIREKLGVLYDGAAFGSGLLVLLSLVNVEVQRLAVSVTIPLITAGISGMLRSVAGLCPYRMEDVERGASMVSLSEGVS